MTRWIFAAFVAFLLLISELSAQPLLIQPDVSGSMRTSAYASYVAVLMPVLRANAQQISGIEIMPFASKDEGSWTVTRAVFEWGSAPEDTRFDPNSVKLTLAGRLFTYAKDGELANAREKHRLAADQATASFWERVDRSIARARAHLLKPHAGDAPCTSFADLALRSARNRQPQLVITDGVMNCKDSDVPVQEIVSPIALVLLPSRDDRPGAPEARAFITRQNSLKALFPGAAFATADDLGVIEALLTGAAGRTATVPTAPVPMAKRLPQESPAKGATAEPKAAPIVGVAPHAEERAPGASPDAMAAVTESITRLIEDVQRRHVRESFGRYAGQNFSDEDLARFIAEDVPRKAAAAIRADPRVGRLLDELRAIPPQSRTVVLNTVRKPLHKTWTELGRVTPLGQTDAGVRGELLLANAVADMMQAGL